MLDRSVFVRPIAHRGLHDEKRRIIENTAPAFEAAIERDYGIECDVRPAADGFPVVFHDRTMERLIDGKGLLASFSKSNLAGLRHRRGGAPILSLSELFDLVSGRVPLLVEIKSEWTSPQHDFLRQVARQATDYRGPVALMSFDPDVMKAMRELAPQIPRGIVSGTYLGAGWYNRRIGRTRAAALRDLLESGRADPDFYAYEVNGLPRAVTQYARNVAGLPLFAWTVRNAKQRMAAKKWADAMIFEGFTP